VGFGGSMIWFGSSAGVALCSMYPQGRSVGLWLRHGWHVALAYVIGFFLMYALIGWHPNAPHKAQPRAQTRVAGLETPRVESSRLPHADAGRGARAQNR